MLRGRHIFNLFYGFILLIISLILLLLFFLLPFAPLTLRILLQFSFLNLAYR